MNTRESAQNTGGGQGRAPLDETVTFVDDSGLVPRASELEQTNHLTSVTEG